MNLYQLLHDRSDEIVSSAFNALGRSSRKSPKASDAHVHQRLKALCVLTARAVKERNLGPMIAHAELLGREGSPNFDFCETQTAFNVLEESMWYMLVKEVSPENLGEALGLVSTAIGAGKDSLARTYVSVTCKTTVPSLNLRSLFTGVS